MAPSARRAHGTRDMRVSMAGDEGAEFYTRELGKIRVVCLCVWVCVFQQRLKNPSSTSYLY